MAIPLDDQIVCVRREITLRKNVYPRWVEQKKMTAAWAALQIEHMQAVLETLEALAAQEEALQPDLFVAKET